LDELLGERARGPSASTVTLARNSYPGCSCPWACRVVDAFVFGDDAGDAFALVNQCVPPNCRKEIHAGFFDQAAEPFHQAVEETT